MRTELTLSSVEEKNMLLVLRQWEQPSACVVNALRLALRRGGSLEVLRVLPTPFQTGEKPSFMESELTVDERRVTRADTQHWLHSELGGAARNVRVVVAQGDFAEQGARRAKVGGVGLILVSREVRQSGALMTSLARGAERPVLAPNELIDGRPILAATDMRDSRYPVLWQSAQLARQLHASLVVFHNAAPPLPSEANPDSSARLSRERLLDVASILPAPTSAALFSKVTGLCSAHASSWRW